MDNNPLFRKGNHIMFMDHTRMDKETRVYWKGTRAEILSSVKKRDGDEEHGASSSSSGRVSATANKWDCIDV
jgi:hypothetical protein